MDSGVSTLHFIVVATGDDPTLARFLNGRRDVTLTLTGSTPCLNFLRHIRELFHLIALTMLPLNSGWEPIQVLRPICVFQWYC